MSPEKLVYMANQIAKYFAHQPEDQAVASTADHLKKFWDPRMRRTIVAHLVTGRQGLEPLTRQAIGVLRAEAEHQQRLT